MKLRKIQAVGEGLCQVCPLDLTMFYCVKLSQCDKIGHTWLAMVHGDHYIIGIVPGAGIDWGFM